MLYIMIKYRRFEKARHIHLTAEDDAKRCLRNLVHVYQMVRRNIPDDSSVRGHCR
jgi:hypothetical protein